MKSLLLATSLFTVTGVMADECNVHFNGQMSLQQNNLQITLDAGRQLVMDGQNSWLNNRPLDLPHQQQHLLNRYHQHVRDLVPKVAGIAIEAVDLANQGISRAFGELLGEDDDGVVALSEELSVIREDLHDQFFADDGSIAFHSANFEQGKFLDSEFEAKLEEKIETLVTQSIGKLMVSVGTQMLFNGGDMQAFERRMQDFGEQLEQEMEFKAQAIEAKATALCRDMLALDRLEDEIRREIPELASIDMLQVSDQRQAL